MKILSVRNPWAAWIIHGFKTVETRTHGNLNSAAGQRIGIHVSAQMPQRDFLNACQEAYAKCSDHAALWEFTQRHDFGKDLGKIIGTVDYYECQIMTDDNSDAAALCGAYGRYGHFLRDPVIYAPGIPAKGALYLWDYDLG